MFEKFFAYLSGLNTNFGNLAKLLQQKLVALEQFDPDKLDEIIKEEQVYVLQSKGFEGNINTFRAQLGLEGDTLSQMIAQLPEEEQPRFEGIFGRLTVNLSIIKEINDKCQELAENRLHAIGKAIKDLDAASGTSYGDIRNSDDAPKWMNKSI